MTDQQYSSDTRAFQAPFQPFMNAGRSLQAIVAELTKMSQENIEAGAKATQKLREIRSVPDVVDIQTDLMKATFESLNAHVPRIAEIAVSAPVDIIKGYQDSYNKIAEASSAVVQKVSETARDVGEKAAATAREATDKTWEASREATDKTLEASRQATDKAADAARRK